MTRKQIKATALPTFSLLVEPFDPAPYTRSPVINMASGIALCRSLAKACPAKAPAPVARAAERLVAVADAAEAVWAQRARSGALTDEDTKAVDQEADGSWSALRGRLVAYAQLPAARYPMAGRAAELVATLFGAEGLAFLKLPYPMQWATMNMLLGRIEDEGLGRALDEVAGPEFLEQIRDVHERYGAMVHAMAARSDDAGLVYGPHLRAMARAIVAYATQIAATVDDDDPTTIVRAREALRAIDAHREGVSRRQGSSPPAAGAPDATPRPAEPVAQPA